MKVNLKKIGAIIAGATILATSVAFAGSLMFGNTVLVNDQGNTAAKVVVGENALASDGVAAANIAAQIAANAWKGTKFTAQVGTGATCSTGAAGNSSGTCAVTNKKAMLTITVPGSATPGTYTLNSLVGTITGRTLNDRGLSSLQVYNLTTPETSQNDAHPFTDGGSATGLGVTNQFLYRIDGNMFDQFKQVTVNDNDAGKTFKESQYLFVDAYNQYQDAMNAIGGRFKDFIYQVKFDGDQYGIPVCDQSVNKSWEYSSGACATSDAHATQNHKVVIKFLGSDWVITKLDNGGVNNEANETIVQNGGEVDLAKQTKGGIVNVGDCLDGGNGLKVCLDDIKSGNTASEQSAIVSVKDANGAVLKQTTVTPGTTQTIGTAAGSQVRVRVFKTAPGYTFGAKWADMSVISNEMILKDGDIVQVNGDRDVNSNWKVKILWKNRDVDATTTLGNVSDQLRSIIIYRDISDYFKTGQGYNLVENPTGYTMTFKGLDLDPSKSSDYDTLNFEWVDTSGGFSYVADGSTSTTRQSNASGYIRITTKVPGGFSTGAGTGNEVRVLLMKGTSDLLVTNISSSAATGFSGANWLIPGSVMLKLTGTPERWTYLGNLTSFNTGIPATTSVFSNDTYVNVQYSTAGSGASLTAGGLLRIGWGGSGNGSSGQNWQSSTGTNNGANFSVGLGLTNAAPASVTMADVGGVVLLLSEDAGEGQSASKPDAIAAYFNITAQSFDKDAPNHFLKDKCTFASVSNFSATPVGYDLLGTTSMPNQRQTGFITQRGTICSTLTDTLMSLKVPLKPAHAQFQLSTSAATAGQTNGYQATLAKGDSYTIPNTGGIVIQATDITADVGACGVGAGGSPACVVDTSQQGALVLADGKNPQASYTGALPGNVNQQLVVLDRDAQDTDVLVSVGGPAVNTVTNKILQGQGFTFDANNKKLVKEMSVGKKIVVAGLTASDTLDAAKDFIAQLKTQ